MIEIARQKHFFQQELVEQLPKGLSVHENQAVAVREICSCSPDWQKRDKNSSSCKIFTRLDSKCTVRLINMKQPSKAAGLN